jgi:DNA-binding protein YbaB
MNPMDMMKLTNSMKKFQENHPKIFSFFAATRDDYKEGSVIEISVTAPGGEKKTANLKLNADDMEAIEMLKNMR